METLPEKITYTREDMVAAACVGSFSQRQGRDVIMEINKYLDKQEALRNERTNGEK